MLASTENSVISLSFIVKGVKVISNAGGVNPEACAAALKAVCEAAGVDLNIAVVTGDDLMSQVSQWLIFINSV
jgi:phosphoribosylanthranilate isomerase